MTGSTLKTPLKRREKEVALTSESRGEWFQSQRLRFIESRLFWSGRLRSRDLTERFNIHRSVASRDFGVYQKLAPRNMLYDRGEKYFLAGRYFLPIFGSPTLDKLAAHSVLGDEFPADSDVFNWLPQISRYTDPAVARNVSECIKSGQELRVVYRSMSEPDGVERWISPVALVSDGRRWHARAYCHLRHDYRDFVLGRITGADQTRENSLELPRDEDWEEIITVQVIPHPSLSNPQQALVRMEYNMGPDGFAVECRKALLLYALVSMGLDTDGSPPQQTLSLADPSIRFLL